MYANPVHGLDISMYQPNISWAAIEAAEPNIEYVWIKTSEGTNYVDPWWERHRSAVKQTSLKWGGYHFGSANGPDWWGDATAEAEFFHRNGGMDGPLPGMLDMEKTSLNRNDTIAWSDRFCQRIEELSGRKPVVYWGPYFATDGGNACMNDPRMQHCVWWMPSYTGVPTPVDPDPNNIPWPKTNGPRQMDIWQYSSQGRIPGYSGNLDVNVMDRSTFDRLLGAPPAPAKKKKRKMQTVMYTQADSKWAAKVGFPPGNHTFVAWDGFIRHLGTMEEVETFKIAAYVQAVNGDEPTINLILDKPTEDRWFETQTLVPHDRLSDPSRDEANDGGGTSGGSSGSGATPDQVRTVVREEIDKTKLTSI